MKSSLSIKPCDRHINIPDSRDIRKEKGWAERRGRDHMRRNGLQITRRRTIDVMK